MMTVRQAAAAAATMAALAHLPALGNRFTLDDTPIIEENPAAHSLPAALSAFGRPYWPPPHDAGQWRPLVILSFAADWQLSGGSAAWLHATNVLWHAAATGLLVPVLAAYTGPAGALAGGIVFAVHPVHVEAVANLVGRSELMVAALLFVAILLARRAAAARAASRRAWPAELGVLACVALALLSKEHAAVAVAILALDHLALRDPSRTRLPISTWVGVLAVSAAWLAARRTVEAGMSFGTVAPTFFDLPAGGRLGTMGPVVFEVVRLLAWPFRLSPDYHPRVIERLEHLTPLAAAGFLMLGALGALALLLWRRNRAAAAGLLLIGIAWLPTSNLLFPSGIVLAERTLYLPSAGLALLVAAGAAALLRRRGRLLAVAALALVLGSFTLQTLKRIPVWKDTRALVLDGVLTRPESYKVRQASARVLMKTGHISQALREYSIAAELYAHDRFLLREAGSAALAGSQPRLALRFLEGAFRLDSNDTLTRQLYARARAEAGPAAARGSSR